MALYIDNCLHKIEGDFISLLIGKIDFDNTEEWADYQKFLSELNTLSSELIFNLNLSVITGEYIRDNDFDDELKKLSKSLNNLSNLSIISDSDLENIKANSFNDLLVNSFIIPFDRAVDYYRSLVSFCDTTINSIQEKFIMDVFKLRSGKEILTNNKYPRFNEINEFIKFNIRLARIDHALVASEDLLKQLALLKNELNTIISPSQIHVLLNHKCSFLIKKILLSKKRNSVSYKMNFDILELAHGNIEIGGFHFFDRKIPILDNSNTDEEAKNCPLFNEHIAEAKNKFSKKEKLSFEDYHTLIRYYKDFNTDKNKIRLLIESFELLQNSFENKFNKKAYYISLNYLHNNYLSLLIRDFKKSTNETQHYLNTKEIKDYLDKIISIQRDNEILNYFPYRKIAESISLELNSIYEKNTDDDDIKRAAELISELEKVVTVLKENYEWCDKNKFLIFQYPFEECAFPYKIENESINVFLNSSFVLPTNYAIDKINIKKIDDELNSLITIHKLHKSIADDKKEIKETKFKVEQGDKKNIEILSIFSAIVVFGTGSIQLFPFIESPAAALHFLLVFSFSLTSFVLVIWLITRESEIRKLDFPILHKSFLAGFIFIALYLGVLSYNFKEPDFDKFTENQKNDSINISKLKDRHIIDSVKIIRLNNRVDSLVKNHPSKKH